MTMVVYQANKYIKSNWDVLDEIIIKPMINCPHLFQKIDSDSFGHILSYLDVSSLNALFCTSKFTTYKLSDKRIIINALNRKLYIKNISLSEIFCSHKTFGIMSLLRPYLHEIDIHHIKNEQDAIDIFTDPYECSLTTTIESKIKYCHNLFPYLKSITIKGFSYVMNMFLNCLGLNVLQKLQSINMSEIQQYGCCKSKYKLKPDPRYLSYDSELFLVNGKLTRAIYQSLMFCKSLTSLTIKHNKIKCCIYINYGYHTYVTDHMPLYFFNIFDICQITNLKTLTLNKLCFDNESLSKLLITNKNTLTELDLSNSINVDKTKLTVMDNRIKIKNYYSHMFIEKYNTGDYDYDNGINFDYNPFTNIGLNLIKFGTNIIDNHVVNFEPSGIKSLLQSCTELIELCFDLRQCYTLRLLEDSSLYNSLQHLTIYAHWDVEKYILQIRLLEKLKTLHIIGVSQIDHCHTAVSDIFSPLSGMISLEKLSITNVTFYIKKNENHKIVNLIKNLLSPPNMRWFEISNIYISISMRENYDTYNPYEIYIPNKIISLRNITTKDSQLITAMRNNPEMLIDNKINRLCICA
jgi:hypothetical protein